MHKLQLQGITILLIFPLIEAATTEKIMNLLSRNVLLQNATSHVHALATMCIKHSNHTNSQANAIV